MFWSPFAVWSRSGSDPAGARCPASTRAVALLRAIRSVRDTLAGPLGRCVRASISCHARWSSVWSCSRYNIRENDVVGMYNAVYVVKIIVYIDCGNCTLHSLVYNVVVMSFVIFDCCRRLPVCWCPFLVRSCGCAVPRISPANLTWIVKFYLARCPCTLGLQTAHESLSGPPF